MKEKITAVTLGLIRYSDGFNIATLYTRHRGRVAALVPAGKRRTAPPLLPMSVIEGELTVRNGASVGRLSRYSYLEVPSGIMGDVRKNAVALFLSEFLSRLLREEQGDEALWEFLCMSLRLLDGETDETAIANFHIVFMSNMLYFSGIQPDTEGYGAAKWFDCRAGRYVDLRPSHHDVLPPDLNRWPTLLERLNFANSRALRLSGRDRYELACGILRYYAVHVPGMAGMEAHHVLREVFA